MLWTIAVIMLALWLLGLITAHTMGGFVHIQPSNKRLEKLIIILDWE